MTQEHGVIFDAESMRANLTGRKTQTRRLRGLEEVNEAPDRWRLVDTKLGRWFFSDGQHEIIVRCPYGVAGDTLWARETWAVYRLHTENGGRELPNVLYRDDSTRLILNDDVVHCVGAPGAGAGHQRGGCHSRGHRGRRLLQVR